MNDITHEILSVIHHLLSIATEQELRRAIDLPNTSSHLKNALKSLAEEKASTTKWSEAKETKAQVSRKEQTSEKLYPDSQINAITRSLAGLSKSQIQDACKNVGLAISIKPKDARDRIAQRLANIFATMTVEDRNRVLSTFQTKVDTQTEGWIAVIRKKGQ